MALMLCLSVKVHEDEELEKNSVEFGFSFLTTFMSWNKNKPTLF